MKSITVAKSARFGADIFVLFVSVPQLKCWGSPDVGGEGSMCNHFPTLAHFYENVMLPVILAVALQLQGF